MLTYNFRTLLGYAIGNHWAYGGNYICLRDWNGDWAYPVETANPWIGAIAWGFADNGNNRGPFDYSTESDFISSNKSFWGGARMNVYEANSISGGMLILGSGTTEPSKGDYKLESWIPTSKLQYISSRQVCFVNNNDNPKRNPEYACQLVYTYQNVSSDPITIGEIGLVNFCRFNKGDGTAYYTSKLLLARNVLSNPVTIAPGESYTFTMVFK